MTMFGFGSRKSSVAAAAVDIDMLRRYGEDVVRHLYRGTFDREADPEGLRNWTHELRETGRLDTVLNKLVRSPEFRRYIFHVHDDPWSMGTDLPQTSRRIAVVANCQGEVLARTIQALTGCRLVQHRLVVAEERDDPRLLVAPLRQLVAENDVVLMQQGIARLVVKLAPELAGRIELFPNLGFTAFHPDQCIVFRHPRLSVDLVGPIGPYHSSIAYFAWRAGMSVQQALDHFRADVYSALRFDEYWDVSVAAMVKEGRAAGLPLESLIEKWRLRGCFMHSTSHPKLFVLADIARVLLERLGLQPLPIEPSDYLHDLFGSSAVWPVYPEIGRTLGIAGHYQFKPINLEHALRAPVRFIDLEQMVTQSFAAYESVDRDSLRSERKLSLRYLNVFGSDRGTGARVFNALPGPAADTAASRPRPRHPYAGLPAQRFWRRSVVETPVAAVDPVGPVRFVFDPATRIGTAGSCFAQNISRALLRRGCTYQIAEAAPADLPLTLARSRQYGVYSARYGNLYTARQLVQLVDRAFADFTPAEPAWLRPDGRWADPFRPEIEPSGFVSPESLHADRARHFGAVRSLFETTEVFVFTLGLTEAWTSTVDGAVFPLAPAVVAGEYDPTRHAFVNFGVDEVIEDLERFVIRLKAINPGARILLTVSPVPLAATWEARHVLASTIHSKSVLRVAAETICRRHGHVDYFPAYEIVAAHYNRGAYYEADLRSVTGAGVDHVMRLFFEHYLPAASAALPDAELLEEATRVHRIFCEEEKLDQPVAD